jgi:uncharacterized protein YdhG (YjbR/CyaY superfamily)
LKINTPEEYIAQIPEDRKAVFQQLREVIIANLPAGFEEVISYGMLGYVVPHSIYPSGYHCDSKLPLPFLAIASQKNFIAVYHMGIYADEKLLNWFVEEYPKHSNQKLDMGKSCIRFKKMENIPMRLLAELMKKMTVNQWISLYESKFKK